MCVCAAVQVWLWLCDALEGEVLRRRPIVHQQHCHARLPRIPTTQRLIPTHRRRKRAIAPRPPRTRFELLLSRGYVEAGTAEASPILVDFDGGLVGDGGPVLVDSGFVGEVEADDEGRGDDAPRCAHQWHLHVRGRDWMLARSLAEFSFSESLLSYCSAHVAMHCHGRGHTTCTLRAQKFILCDNFSSRQPAARGRMHHFTYYEATSFYLLSADGLIVTKCGWRSNDLLGRK